MRRAGVVLASVAATVALLGCASADHTWQGEFTARLEAASAVVEEAREEFRSHSLEELFPTYQRMGETLFFKSELIKKLTPPAGCEAVQVKGKAAVYGASESIGSLFKNMTPRLEHDFPQELDDEIATMEKREREASHCATG